MNLSELSQAVDALRHTLKLPVLFAVQLAEKMFLYLLEQMIASLLNKKKNMFLMQQFWTIGNITKITSRTKL